MTVLTPLPVEASASWSLPFLPSDQELQQLEVFEYYQLLLDPNVGFTIKERSVEGLKRVNAGDEDMSEQLRKHAVELIGTPDFEWLLYPLADLWRDVINRWEIEKEDAADILQWWFLVTDALLERLYMKNDPRVLGSFDTTETTSDLINSMFKNNVISPLLEADKDLLLTFAQKWVPYAHLIDLRSNFSYRTRGLPGDPLADLPSLPNYSDRRDAFHRFGGDQNVFEIVADKSLPPQWRLSALESSYIAIRDGMSSSSTKKAKEAAARNAAYMRSEAFISLFEDENIAKFMSMLQTIVMFENNRLNEQKVKDAGSFMAKLMITLMEAMQKDFTLFVTKGNSSCIYLLFLRAREEPAETISKIFGYIIGFFDVDIMGFVISDQFGSDFGNMLMMITPGTGIDSKHYRTMFRFMGVGSEDLRTRLSTTLYSLMNHDPMAFGPYVEYAFKDYLQTTTLPMVFFQQVAQKQPLLFLPYVDKIFEAIAVKPKDITASASRTYVTTALKSVVSSATETFLEPNTFAALHNALIQGHIISATYDMSAYAAKDILDMLSIYSEASSKLVTPIIISWLLLIVETASDAATPIETTMEGVTIGLIASLRSVYHAYPEMIPDMDRAKIFAIADQTEFPGDGIPGRIVKIQSAQTRSQLKDFANDMRGVSLENMLAQMSASFKHLGIDPTDEFFGAVQESLTNGNQDKFDVMLSYNWSHQKTVIRIRDSLIERGLTVWLDLEQMSGNVYAKMANAVLGSSVVCPCLTAAYEASGNCKRELGFAADQTRMGKKIVPIRLENGPFTWSALITAGLLYTQIGDNELQNPSSWETTMDNLYKEICAALDSAGVPAAPAAAPATAPAAPAVVEPPKKKEETKEIIIVDPDVPIPPARSSSAAIGNVTIASEELEHLEHRITTLEQQANVFLPSVASIESLSAGLASLSKVVSERAAAPAMPASAPSSDVESRINQLTSSVGGLASGYASVAEKAFKVDELSERVDGLGSTVGGIADGFTRMNEKVDRLDAFEERLRRLEGAVEKVKSASTPSPRESPAVKEEVSAMGHRITSLETTVAAQAKMIKMLISLLGVTGQVKSEE
ncbi:hypothetical protein HDU97_001348 [Phlyctochytrium planicorne]|nr:hypothetical protein HDU97_001348 [Phlyctochytrium planicorne]